MKFDFVTAFPLMIESYMGQSLMKKALDTGVIAYHVLNPRNWSLDRHQSIDDKAFGGGEGMVGKPEPYIRGLQEYRRQHQGENFKIIHLSPQGRPLSTAIVQDLGQCDRLCLVSSRYSGLDQRILNTCMDDEISLGDYVVAGGELPALVLAEAICRFVPGFLGDAESAQKDSFSIQGLEGPLFTQPRVFEQMAVPDVYLQGHHQKIEMYRKVTGILNTMLKRPDMRLMWPNSDLQQAWDFIQTAPEAELEALGFLKHKVLLQTSVQNHLAGRLEKAKK